MGRLLTALSRKTGINKLMLALPCLPSPGKHRPSVSTGELRKLAPDRGSTAVREKSRAGFVHDRFDLAIIVPVYQAESYLYQCVESLVNQKTEIPYQIILVDDGTTDRSFEKIACFLQDEKISVIHQENRGPSAARNRGIDSAQASYLCFVDSDDFVDALMVERLMKRAIQTGADVVVGNFPIITKIQEESRKIGWKTEGRKIFTISTELPVRRFTIRGFLSGSSSRRGICMRTVL